MKKYLLSFIVAGSLVAPSQASYDHKEESGFTLKRGLKALVLGSVLLTEGKSDLVGIKAKGNLTSLDTIYAGDSPNTKIYGSYNFQNQETEWLVNNKDPYANSSLKIFFNLKEKDFLENIDFKDLETQTLLDKNITQSIDTITNSNNNGSITQRNVTLYNLDVIIPAKKKQNFDEYSNFLFGGILGGGLIGTITTAIPYIVDCCKKKCKKEDNIRYVNINDIDAIKTNAIDLDQIVTNNKDYFDTYVEKNIEDYAKKHKYEKIKDK